MKNPKKLSAFVLSFSILFVFSFALVSAQHGEDPNPREGVDSNPSSGEAKGLPNPFSRANNIFQLLQVIINDILLPIGGVLAVLAFIFSGFLYVTAQGNESKLATAHKALLYTAIGTAVLLGSWVIANVIENTISQLR